MLDCVQAEFLGAATMSFVLVFMDKLDVFKTQNVLYVLFALLGVFMLIAKEGDYAITLMWIAIIVRCYNEVYIRSKDAPHRWDSTSAMNLAGSLM